MHSKSSKAKRLAASLSEIARVGDDQARLVLNVLSTTLSGSVYETPRNLLSLLELLRELLAITGSSLESADTRQYLEMIKTSGRSAKLVKELLGT